jgi:hypothetical protein
VPSSIQQSIGIVLHWHLLGRTRVFLVDAHNGEPSIMAQSAGPCVSAVVLQRLVPQQQGEVLKIADRTISRWAVLLAACSQQLREQHCTIGPCAAAALVPACSIDWRHRLMLRAKVWAVKSMHNNVNE